MQFISATRTCASCGQDIRGRSDKKFCDDYCRSAFNNKQNNDVNLYIRSVDRILRRNRRILEELIPNETARTSRSRLLEKGFNFKYYTNTYTNKKGSTYFFCYEYGYLPMENGSVLLIKRNEEGA